MKWKSFSKISRYQWLIGFVLLIHGHQLERRLGRIFSIRLFRCVIKP